MIFPILLLAKDKDEIIWTHDRPHNRVLAALKWQEEQVSNSLH